MNNLPPDSKAVVLTHDTLEFLKKNARVNIEQIRSQNLAIVSEMIADPAVADDESLKNIVIRLEAMKQEFELALRELEDDR